MFTSLFTEELKFSTKTDYVVETIRTAILAGDLPPGTWITEQEMKDALKVSSSPIREAFNQLVAEGLLNRTAHVGVRVTEMDVGNFKDLYLIQSLLQSVAVQICTKKLEEKDILEAEHLHDEMRKICQEKFDAKKMRVLNYEFHMILCGVNIYPWLTRLISGLWVRFASQNPWLNPKRPKTVIQEHENIITAVKRRDEVLAGSLMKEHLENSMKAIFEDRKK